MESGPRAEPPASLPGQSPARPGPAGVPGAARAAGGLRPKDPAQEPAEPGPGGLARRAQPLAHGPGAGCYEGVPLRAAPATLSPPDPAAPAPGWSEPEKQRDLASPSTGPRPECRPGLPIPSGTQLASTGKSAFWIPLGFLSAKNQRQVWLNLGWLFPMNNNNDHNNNNHLWFFTVYKAPFPVISSTLSKPGQEGNSILSSPL